MTGTLLTTWLIGLALIALAAPAAAQPPAAPTPAAAHPLTGDDVGAWLDGVIPYGLARNDIAGAVVVVVKNGQVLVERGYGRLARIACLADLVALAAWVGLIVAATSAARGLFDAALDPWLLAVEGITLLAVALSIAPLWNLFIVWRDRTRGWWARASSLVVA
ncbi:MAG TPA: hypothetical protein VG248_11985, partial [Caulobacteraceae bacterium]|nr:hypothetical protein [Caulobacteraceae bacterium]